LGWIRQPELMTRDLWWHVPGEQRWVSVAVTVSRQRAPAQQALSTAIGSPHRGVPPVS
jgi:hypothetical protein